MLDQDRGRQHGWISPGSLLLGVVSSFVACCLAGRVVSRHNLFPRFVRFYKEICPESQFYPTAHQVQAIAHSRLDRDKVAVIVGGNSILRGYGQVPEQVWTRYLQEELGDDYRVLNLALNGAFPLEFGSTAAEILSRDFPKMIFISDLSMHSLGPGDPLLPPEAREAAVPKECFYGFFFWEAYFKGLVPADARRKAAIAALAARRARDKAQQEQMRGLRQDAVVYSRDLWTALAATRLCTIWLRPELVQPPFTRPRRQYPDLDGLKLPADYLHSPAYIAKTLTDLRSQIAHRKKLESIPREGPLLEHNDLLFLPPTLRGRTLLVVLPYSPYYVSRLTPSEQVDYRAGQAMTVREAERVGVAALESVTDYTPADYADFDHLSESGGKKLAVEVAPAVRRLAERLGYAAAPAPRQR